MSDKSNLTSAAASEKPTEPARTETKVRKTYLRRILDSLRSRLAKKLSLAAVVLGGFVAVGHFLGGLIGWWHAYEITFRDHAPPAPSNATASTPLRSVMIIPFTAVPGDPTLAAAAGQITDGVTRALGNSMRDARVASARVAEAYAGRTSDAKAVGREADVRFVVEGDLRPVGTQVEFTLRLVDTRDASQAGSVRTIVDRSQLGDNEALIRELTSLTRGMVWGAIQKAVASDGSRALSAQDIVDRAYAVSIPDPIANAREMVRLAEAAIKLDPNLADGYDARALGNLQLYFRDLSAEPAPLIAAIDADTLRAVALDSKDAYAWTFRFHVLRLRGNGVAAVAALDRAEAVDPTRSIVRLQRGYYYLDTGKPEETLRLLAQLRPVIGAEDWTVAFQACKAQLLLGAYDEAVTECERTEAAAGADWIAPAHLTAALAMRGDLQKATRAKERLLTVAPLFTIGRYESRFHPWIAPEAVAMDKRQIVAGLRKAGVPE